MADVDIDLGRLEATTARCRMLEDSFGRAEDFADDLADATGHGGLQGKVEQFGDDWGNAREALCEGLKSVGDLMEAIVDTFRDLDTKMSTGLETQESC